MTPKEFFLQTPHFKIAAKSWGTPQLPKVLALHGWLDNLATFDPIAPLLEGMHLTAIDLLGHGLSDHRPPGSIYHFLDAVPHVVQVADTLGWEKFSILGHSMGASIAPLVSGTIPERIQTLLLIEGLGPFSRNPVEVPEQLARHLIQANELLKKRVPIYKTEEEAADMRKRAGDLSFESALLLSRRGLKKVDGGFTWRADPRLRLESPARMSEEQVQAFLQRTTCPVLYIEAENGLKLNLDHIEQRKKLLRHLTSVRLPGGHHLHLDNPAPCARTINEFFQKEFRP